MRDRLFERIGQWAYKYPWRVISIVAVIFIVSIVFSEHLKITTSWSDLLPKDDPKVKEYKKILNQYESASLVMVVLQGKEERIKKYAEEVAPVIESIDSVKFVKYKIDEDFIRNHALMLMKKKDLDSFKDVFSDGNLIPLITNINEALEKEYVYSDDEEVLSNKEKTDNAVMFLDGVKNWLQVMEKYSRGNGDEENAVKAVDVLLTGDPYYLSYDKNVLMMVVQPNFPITNTDACIYLSDKIDEILDNKCIEYPDVEAGITGFIVIARDEMRSVSSDMFFTTIIAFVLIIALFIISFRMWISPVLAGLTLIVGVTITMGFAVVVFGYLNIFTSMFAVVLIGLGIDFSIHIITGFTENRGYGKSISESILITLKKSGAGIMTGGVTTAIAFLTLLVSSNRGMYEFGAITGAGVLFCMLSAIVFLPALLVIREKRLEKKGRNSKVKNQYAFTLLGKTAELMSNRKIITLVIGVLITLFFVYQAFNLKFDYDMLNIEPKGLESVALNDTIVSRFDLSPDFAMVTADNLDSVRAIVERAKRFKNISMVESISDYLPSESDQNEKIPLIKEVRDKIVVNKDFSPVTTENFARIIEQLDRLWMNVTEMSSMAFTQGQDRLENKCFELVANPDNSGSSDYIKELINSLKLNKESSIAGFNEFQNDYRDYFYDEVIKMTNTSIITIDDLPEDMKVRYISKDKGHYLITIYAKQNVWNLENLESFNMQLEYISHRSTGSPVWFMSVMNLVKKDGKKATILAVFVIFLILLIDFRKIKFVIMAMIPLVLGVFWMAGVTNMVGMMINVVNIMGIPLIFGIGIDDGVHIVHRYRIEGSGKIRLIFSSTGKAILLTSITTMLAFGSLGFATYRGMATMGIILFIGVAACFLTTVLVIAPLMKFMKYKCEV